MNYLAIYESLISKAKLRNLEGYTETHHIIPKCMGGTDSTDNLVKLTPEEHYIAHQLLCKIYPNNNSLAKAVLMMTVNRSSNKLYGWIRRKHAEAMRKDQLGEKNTQYGTFWVHDPITKFSKKIRVGEEIPPGWRKGRRVKKMTDKEKAKEKTKIDKENKISFLRKVMYFYRDNNISMRQLSKKFSVGHNVYVSFERYFKDEYKEIVKSKKGNSNVAKGRY
jgi:hypothetical protein